MKVLRPPCIFQTRQVELGGIFDETNDLVFNGSSASYSIKEEKLNNLH